MWMGLPVSGNFLASRVWTGFVLCAEWSSRWSKKYTDHEQLAWDCMQKRCNGYCLCEGWFSCASLCMHVTGAVPQGAVLQHWMLWVLQASTCICHEASWLLCSLFMLPVCQALGAQVFAFILGLWQLRWKLIHLCCQLWHFGLLPCYGGFPCSISPLLSSPQHSSETLVTSDI